MDNQLVQKLLTLSNGELNIRDTLVIAPLTTTVDVRTPSDVIGFIWLSSESEYIWLTLPDRDWEATARWTGLTRSLYETAIITEEGLKALFKDIKVVIAFAGRITCKAFEALSIPMLVIDIPKLVAAHKVVQSENTSILPGMEKFMAGDEKEGSLKDAVTWVNKQTPMRMLSRIAYIQQLQAAMPDGGETYPMMERNIRIDKAILDAL